MPRIARMYVLLLVLMALLPLAAGALLASPEDEPTPKFKRPDRVLVATGIAHTPNGIQGAPVYYRLGKPDAWKGDWTFAGRTNDQGMLAIEHLPRSTLALFRVYSDTMVGRDGKPGRWSLWGQGENGRIGVAMISAAEALLAKIEFVDAETGAPIERVFWGSGWMQRNKDAPRICVSEYVKAVAGEQADFGFHAQLPEGYLAWHPMGHRCPLPSGVKYLRAVYPVHRPLPVQLRILEADGKAAPESSVFAFVMGHRTVLDPEQERAPDGSIHLKRVPFLPGSPLTLHVRTKAAPTRSATIETVIPSDRSKPLVLSLHLPEGDASTYAVPTAPSAAPPLPPTLGIDKQPQAEKPGDLVILCQYADGRNAPKVRLLLEGPSYALHVKGTVARLPRRASVTTDYAGRAELKGIESGSWRVLWDGLHAFARVVRVRTGEETTLKMHERAGALVQVAVVDEQGKPLPFPIIRLSTGPERSRRAWRRPPAERVRVDDFGDHGGRRTFERVAAGPVTVEATWGGLSGSVQLSARNKGEHPVTIVVRP